MLITLIKFIEAMSVHSSSDSAKPIFQMKNKLRSNHNIVEETKRFNSLSKTNDLYASYNKSNVTGDVRSPEFEE